MYVLIVYDVNEKRVAKVLKYLRTYLNWIQNSVLEGEVTEGQLTEIKSGLKKITNQKEDSIIIFKARHKKWLTKEIIGQEKNEISNFI